MPKRIERDIFMPIGANIPKEWCIHIDDVRTRIVFPSRSVPGLIYHVEMDNRTRKLTCECPGFVYHRYCSHIAGLMWCCYKKARTKGVQNTSMDSFHSFTPEELGDRQRAVYEELLKGPGSNRELSERMNWPINTITPRVNELREMGAVIDAGKQHDDVTNRDVIVWMAMPGLVLKGSD